MPKSVRLECPNCWIENPIDCQATKELTLRGILLCRPTPIDGERNLIFFTNLICCLAQKKIPISVETVEFGSDTAQRHPMGGGRLFFLIIHVR